MSKNSADPFLKIREKQKKTRLPLSGEQKIELLHKLDRGVSVMRLTVEYGVGTTTIYDLKRQRDKLLEFYTGINDREVSKLRKKTQKTKNEDLDRMLVEWIKQELKRNCGLPLSSSVVIKQAFKYHEELNIEGEGEYTERWLQKFEKRHNINYLNSYDRTTSSWNKTTRTYNNVDKTESLSPNFSNGPETSSRLNPTSEILSSANSFVQNDSPSHPTAAKQKKTDRQFGSQFFEERQQGSLGKPILIGESHVQLPSQRQVPQHMQVAHPPPPPAPPAPRQMQALAPPVQVPVAKPKPVEKPRPREKRIFVVADHQRCVMSNLSSLWKSGKLCDAGIGNGTSMVLVHKVVLSAVCPKLLSVFSTDVLSQKFLQVNFPDEVSTEALNAFAEYMYNGILDLDREILEQLKIIAKRLDMKEFMQLCDSHLPNPIHQPSAATVSFTNFPSIQTNMSVPAMSSSADLLGSPVSISTECNPSITTRVIDVKQEITEADLAQVQKDTAAIFGQESAVAPLAPNKSGNSAGFVICPSIKTEPVETDDNRYGQSRSNRNSNQVFTSTTSPSSSTATYTSISSVPSSSSSTEFSIPFSQSTDIKSTRLKTTHSYETPLVSDLSPVSHIVEAMCSQPSPMSVDSSKSVKWPPAYSSCTEGSTSTSSESIYPVGLFTSAGDSLPILTTETVDVKTIDLY